MLSIGRANKQIVKSAAGIRRIYSFAFSIVIFFSTLIPTGEQSGLLTRTAATESVSLCERMKG
jgi:hypothetical protein